jgi:hypothetical protein
MTCEEAKVKNRTITLTRQVRDVHKGVLKAPDQMWLTPSATMRDERSPEAMKKREEYRKSIGRTTVPPGSLAEQVKYGTATTDMKEQKMWPTPTNQEAGKGKFLETLTTKEGDPAKQGKRAYNPKTGKHVQITLDRAAKMWPTPTVGCVEGGEQSNRVEKTKTGSYILRKKNKPENTFGAKLSDAVLYEEKQMWPTPQKADHLANPSETLEAWEKRAAEKKKQGINLQFALRHAVQKNWPTPTARDWKDSGKAVVNSQRHSLPQTVAKNDKEQWIKGGGALNPTWVEWLMGYPAEYTDLKHWAILSSRKSSKK